jgi:hypothetical protein
MPLEPLATWQSTYADEVGPTADPITGALAIANWLGDRLDGKLSADAGIGGPGLTYTFNRAIFATALSALPPTPDATAGALAFATAWETAALISIPLMAPLSYILVATPATTWSVVTTTILDAPSVVLGKAEVFGLKDAEPAPTAEKSETPEAFREAHLLHTITTTGIDSTISLPLVDVARGVA